MVALILLAAILFWCPPAHASAGFPAAVDQALGLTGNAVVEKNIDPPSGCRLCHQTDNGGPGTNNAFGSEMKQAGLVGGETAKVATALQLVGQQNPQAIQDIRDGVNPNDDPAASAGRPVPQYGCGSVTGAPDASACAGAGIVAAAGLALARRRRGAKASRSGRIRR
jgi:hypothetical protein